MQKKTTTTKKKGGVVATGIELAAVGAAAAGYYFYASKDAKRNRARAARWAQKMKRDVLKRANRLDRADAKSIASTIDAAARAYRGARAVRASDLNAAVRELKANWRLIQHEAQKAGRRDAACARAVRKRVLARSRKTVKKVVKKARRGARGRK